MHKIILCADTQGLCSVIVTGDNGAGADRAFGSIGRSARGVVAHSSKEQDP